MDQTTRSNLDASLRQAALQQAAHDFRGSESGQEVVKRAKEYYEFLRGALDTGSVPVRYERPSQGPAGLPG